MQSVRVGKSLREGLVDLDLVERKRQQIAERRIAGSKVVQRDGDADILELLNDQNVALLVLQQQRFGDLQFQPFRRQPRLHQRAQNDVEQCAGPELPGREIDRDLDVLRPGNRVGARLLQDPLSQRLHQSGLLREPMKLSGYNRPCGRMAPSDQRFHSAQARRPGVEQRLIMQLEFVARQRRPHVVDQLQPRDRVLRSNPASKKLKLFRPSDFTR